LEALAVAADETVEVEPLGALTVRPTVPQGSG
jgi:hypothetical protein